jgi:hypothetical protein
VAAAGFEPALDTLSTCSLYRRLGYTASRFCFAVRTRIELALGGRQPPRFPDAYRTNIVVVRREYRRLDLNQQTLPSEGCARSTRRRRVSWAPGAGFEPAVRRSTGVCVANFATLVCGKSRERTCRPGPHRGAITRPNARRLEYRPGVAPGSLAWKARSSLLGQRYERSEWSGQRELPPRLRLGKPVCLSQHLGHVSSSAPDSHRHVTRLQLAAYLFGPAEQTIESERRRRRESNARDD